MLARVMDTCIGGDGTSHVQNVSCSTGQGAGVTVTISIPKTNVYFDVVIKIKLYLQTLIHSDLEKKLFEFPAQPP